MADDSKTIPTPSTKGIWLIVLGILILVVGILGFVLGVAPIKDWHYTTATVESIDRNIVQVSYTDAQGTLHDQVRLNLSAMWRKVGQQLTIRIHADGSDAQAIAPNIVLGCALTLAGVILILLGIMTYRTAVSDYRRATKAVAEGQIVTATIAGNHAMVGMRPTRKSKWERLDCVYIRPEDGHIMYFTSGQLPAIGHPIQGSVQVYVVDDSTYYVDLSTMVIDSKPQTAVDDTTDI